MNVKLAQICHNYSLTLHCVQLLTQINLTHIDKGNRSAATVVLYRDDRCSVIVRFLIHANVWKFGEVKIPAEHSH